MDVWTDGVCEPNPGEMGIGIVMEDGREFSENLGQGTNNEAECRAVIRALELLKESGNEENIIYTDSELVVQWVKGEYRLKSETARKFVPEIRKKLKETKTKIVWIPREENEEADLMSKRALGYIVKEVESKSEKGKYYTVTLNREKGIYSCTCPHFVFRKEKCKHIREVENETK